MTDLKEHIGIGMLKSKPSREKKVKRILAKSIGDLTVRQFLFLIGTYCEEFGVSFTKPDTARGFGEIKNFLASCEVVGDDPRPMIRVVIQHWSRMAAGAVTDYVRKENIAIVFPKSFDFGHFYRYRKSIYGWLDMKPPEDKAGKTERAKMKITTEDLSGVDAEKELDKVARDIERRMRKDGK